MGNRPVGIAFDSMNRTWVSSDTTGEILIITPRAPGGNSTSGGGYCCPEGDLSVAAGPWMGRSLKGVLLTVLVMGMWLI
jgi:hypothetical protein